MKGRVILIVSTVALILLNLFMIKSCTEKVQELNKKDKFINALQDTITYKTDKEGRQTATISVMQVSRKELENQLVAKTENEKHLLETVKQYKDKLISATSITLITRDTSSAATKILPGDTVKIANNSGRIIERIYPTYVAVITKPWVKYNIIADKDSVFVSSETRNDMVVDLRIMKDGLFKSHPVVDVKNWNPDTGVLELHSYDQAPPPKKIAVKIGKATIMVGVGFYGGFKLAQALFK